ncbi:AcrR family transcriptional regulator [Amycolatopsis bartoniae]|uniref:TetR family transcriptional regulator n=1 Tax=Amycolatopsis bartoniae TaxID=941986 RepID=A0A8H9MCC9_9PSEU|nr:TetR/AcrR family transcriptional regulator [Amycolatopsis bartoniae]MBB2937188.1 AcrR family transcriptional regulator [Amycolatopsis bartoniae]GHF53103.1 TetR family transcriptional regulator [Amycolatopsis bartoniae]
MTERRLRADARDNRERLLEVAAAAFAREGTQTSLKAIARAAGVGIGTLYRRFPTREALVEAVYRNEVDRLCAAAPELLGQCPPAGALRAWMERFVDFMAAKEGMADTLRAVLLSEVDRLHTRDRLRQAIGTLLDAGAAAGAVRADLAPNDVLLALGGITMIAGAEQQRKLASRLIDLLLGGVLTSVHSGPR